MEKRTRKRTKFRINQKESIPTIAGKDSIVLVYDTHIAFPTAKSSAEVPAGIYYPAVEQATDQFILTRFSPSLIGENSNDFRDMLRELTQDISGLNPFELNRNIHTHEDEGYFLMEKYHAGLKKIEESFQSFLKSRDFFKKNRLGYKRSALLYGSPGTGKSRYIENLAQRFIRDHNAVVIRLESSHDLSVLLQKGIYYINEKMAGRLKIIVIEELATMVMRDNHTELLNLLDHSQLRDDVIFLMTTNNPENIPENIVDRPSRVDILEEIGVNGFSEDFVEAWYEHLIDEPMPVHWKEMPFYREKLSPAYLKELFISMRVNNTDIDTSWAEIEKRRKSIKAQFKSSTDIGF